MRAIFYDGWPLAYRPNSPAALHLLTLLAYHPAALQAVVGLPAASFHELPEGVLPRLAPTPDTPAGLLNWEQRKLPRLAQAEGASCIHQVGGGLPLLGTAARIYSPIDWAAGRPAQERPRRLADRLREALAQGGLARARVALWPADLPAPESEVPLQRLPPIVHPAFVALEEADGLNARAQAALADLHLPQTYVLYHGPTGPADLQHLAEAWHWAAGAIGEQYPLLLAGVHGAAVERVDRWLDQNHLRQTVRRLPRLPVQALARLYQACSAILHPARTPVWGGSLRLGLACGKPVAALEDKWSDGLVGPAGYLAKPESGGRGLGAALLTLVVEEHVATSLSQSARQRAASWSGQDFAEALLALYTKLDRS
ncbi:MAG: glycosyltransferase [Chloroflexota bacterium]